VLEGAATKPFGFMIHYPGAGVGGHCIPVDPYYLIRYAHKNGFSHKFLSLAREINEHMPEFTAEQTKIALEQNDIDIEARRWHSWHFLQSKHQRPAREPVV
jgi:UDP-N-acetyl-D-glucosamine dehydrogenase